MLVLLESKVQVSRLKTTLERKVRLCPLLFFPIVPSLRLLCRLERNTFSFSRKSSLFHRPDIYVQLQTILKKQRNKNINIKLVYEGLVRPLTSLLLL